MTQNRQPSVYILASDSGTLYVGITSHLIHRVWQHKNKFEPESFTAKYNVHKLVWFECFDRMETAIAREKQVKKYRREKKVALIVAANPGWRDRYDDIVEE